MPIHLLRNTIESNAGAHVKVTDYATVQGKQMLFQQEEKNRAKQNSDKLSAQIYSKL